MKRLTKINQSGASAIMLSVFFIVIITLITVGYATIVRREQIATLERNLSSQAQLVAESGVNSVRAYVEKAKSTGVALENNTNCDPLTPPGIPLYNTVKTDFGGPDSVGVKLSCLKWDLSPPDYQFTMGKYGTQSFKLENDPGNGSTWLHTFSLSWHSTESSITNVYPDPGGATKLPDLVGDNVSIIKLVTVTLDEVTDYNATQIIYLVPYNGVSILPGCTTPGCSGSAYVDLGNASVGNLSTAATKGLVYYVPCGTGTCNVDVQGIRWRDFPLNNLGPQAFYFENIGEHATTVTFNGGGGGVLKGVAAKVDSNAIVQDVSKRVIAYLPLQTQTWQPWFGVMSQALCKDYKVDANTNNTGVAIPATPCP